MPKRRGSTNPGPQSKRGTAATGNEQNEYSKNNGNNVDISFLDTERMEVADDDGVDDDSNDTDDSEEDVVERDNLGEVMDTSGDEDKESEEGDGVIGEETDASKEDEDDSEDGASVMDTEPFQNVHDSASEEDEEGLQGFNSKPIAGSSLFEDSLIFNSETEGECEYEEENTAAAPDITCAGPFEVKRIYNELIDTCRRFDDGITPESEKILKENIYTGHSLFQQIESTLSESFNSQSQLYADESKSKRQTKRKAIDSGMSLGNTASDVLISCVHTSMCADMLKQKLESVGVVGSSFSVETFLKALQEKAADSDRNGFSSLDRIRNLATVSTSASITAPKNIYLFGLLHKDNFERVVNVDSAGLLDVKKEKKVRVRPKDEGNNNPTQTEIINETSTTESSRDSKSNAPEALAKNIIKTLRLQYREDNEQPQKILDLAYGITNKVPTVSDFVSRVFGTAFVVRDGCIAVSSPAGTEGREASALLNLEPAAKPPPTSSKDKTKRSQTVVSYSAKFIKELLKSAPINDV